MASLSVISPCKINLCLNILCKREDGYHDLQSIMCPLAHGDEMHFEVCNDGLGKIEISPDFGIPLHSNLIYKAAKLLQEESGRNFSVHVDINKKIRMGAGLGGGSSNAATTLLVVNALAQLAFSQERLCELGASLGSDVPFFVLGQNAIVEGRGEILTPCQINKRYLVVVMPEIHVSTQKVFTDPNLPLHYSAKLSHDLLLKGPYHNDCLPITQKLFCDIGHILDCLIKYGCAHMSGTGSACFCEFDSASEAMQAYSEISNELERSSPVPVHIIRSETVDQSPVHQALASLEQANMRQL